MNITPAPWHVGIVGKNQLRIIGADSERLAVVDHNEGQGPANARLIAEAPELLTMLCKTVEMAWRDHKTPEEQATLEKADNLIGKLYGFSADHSRSIIDQIKEHESAPTTSGGGN